MSWRRKRWSRCGPLTFDIRVPLGDLRLLLVHFLMILSQSDELRLIGFAARLVSSRIVEGFETAPQSLLQFARDDWFLLQAISNLDYCVILHHLELRPHSLLARQSYQFVALNFIGCFYS